MDQVQCMRSIQKPTEGQYSPVRLEQAGFVSSLLYGTRELSKSKHYTAYDRLHGNVPYGKIPSTKEPMYGRYILQVTGCRLQVAGCRLKQLVYLSQSRINPSIEANRKQPKLI